MYILAFTSSVCQQNGQAAFVLCCQSCVLSVLLYTSFQHNRVKCKNKSRQNSTFRFTDTAFSFTKTDFPLNWCCPAERRNMSKHMTLADRAFIERALIFGSSFTSIGEMLGRSPTTISREVRNHRTIISQRRKTDNDCMHYASCLRKNVCPNETKYTCFSRCKLCSVYDCRIGCGDYEPLACQDLNEPPYVCNGCFCEKSCKKNHAYYTAHKAQAAYQRELSESRKGLRISREKLEEIDAIVTPLVRKGQSLNHILATHKDELGVCEKTLYNYVNANAFQVKDIHLPKKVAYRPRKQERPILTRVEYQYRRGREWEAFLAFREQNPDVPVVEMDTVKSA